VNDTCTVVGTYIVVDQNLPGVCNVELFGVGVEVENRLVLETLLYRNARTLHDMPMLRN
jgi:hypothetical protein